MIRSGQRNDNSNCRYYFHCYYDTQKGREAYSYFLFPTQKSELARGKNGERERERNKKRKKKKEKG